MTANSSHRVRLLDLDPDLGDELSPEALEALGTVTLPAFELGAGTWTPPGDLAEHGSLRGCIVVSGMLTRDVSLSNRVATHMYGPRDFVSLDRLEYSSLPLEVEFNVITDVCLAVLDDHLLAAGQRWPQVVGRLLGAATSQLGRLSADQAVSQLPRVEDRIVALFWHFADRWGVRRADDVVVELPLTHEAIGRLVGARRPTVSLGLRELAEDGKLRHGPEGWILSAEAVLPLGGRLTLPRRRAYLDQDEAHPDLDAAR